MNYRQMKISGWEFEINDDFPSQFAPGSSDTFLDGKRSFFVKLPSSKFANVFKFNLLFKGRVHNLILKQYLNRSPLDILKNLLFSCRARRAFKADLMLKQYGFNVPDVVAVGKKTFCGISVRNFLITSEIADSANLYNLMAEKKLQRQDILSQLGQMIGKIHSENIFIGDLRFGNILVKSKGSQCHFERSEAQSRNLIKNENFCFYFLDNERTKKFNELPHKLRLKNLVQIFFSRTDASDSEKDCFLDAYLSQQNVEIDRENLAAQIAAGVKKRLAGKEIRTA